MSRNRNRNNQGQFTGRGEQSGLGRIASNVGSALTSRRGLGIVAGAAAAAAAIYAVRRLRGTDVSNMFGMGEEEDVFQRPSNLPRGARGPMRRG